MKLWMKIRDSYNKVEECMDDLEQSKGFLAKTEIKLGLALQKRGVGQIDSMMNDWTTKQSRHTKSKDVEAQNLTLASTFRCSLQHENMMVGHENEFEMMQDQLTRGTDDLEVVSIVGMGGIGKTTLSNKIYNDPFVLSCFDICAKVTISQVYCARNVLLCLLSSICGKTDQTYEEQDDWQLADQLQKLLKGPRYLIVIDDIWAKDAWDDIKLCFPDCNCRSRILVTTRNMEVAEYASSGSPLAIVVIAGLLSKIGKAWTEWQIIAENIGSVVNTALETQCMKVLALSYHHLPHHLRACFLYFAIFLEDKLIFVNSLVKLWAVEGFLKVDEMKSMEEVAKKCLKDLVDRSLIFIHKESNFDGKIKACGMHDVIRELCLREARIMNFVNVVERKNDQNPSEKTMHFFSKD
ncbi:putative methyltransferase-like protein 5-like [Capsicum annuum]|nr:putative methyltransferase-like protein 5-like [Capsicum annuum]